jgi:hypothetical protein
MFQMLRYLYVMALLPIATLAQSFYLTSQPDPIVLRDSIQTITWKSSLPLQEVEVDLYQTSRFIKKLGETNQNSGTFAWHVGSNPICGDDYFIKVSVLSTNQTRAWANTDTFQLCDTIKFNMVYLCFLLLIPLLCCLFSKKRKEFNHFDKSGLDTPLPVAHVVTGQVVSNQTQAQTTQAIPSPTYIPSAPSVVAVSNPVYDNRSSRSSGSRSQWGTAAAGFAAGVVADELLHHGGHHHRDDFGCSDFGGGNSTTSDFGCGDFGASDFGGGGGDSSGGFS